jgi:hypothetical protein
MTDNGDAIPKALVIRDSSRALSQGSVRSSLCLRCVPLHPLWVLKGHNAFPLTRMRRERR